MKKKESPISFSIVMGCVAIIMIFIVLSLKVYVSYETEEVKGNHHVFGATYMTMNNDFYPVIDSEIKSEVEKNGDKLITLDPALDLEKQKEQIYYLIKQNVDAIFITPVDWKKIDEPLRAAKKAGIPVIVVDSAVYHDNLVSTTIVSDNYNAGKLCAKLLMKQKKEARILLLQHHSAKSARDRIQGFLDTIKDNESYKVVAEADTEGQAQRTLPKVEKMVQSDVDFDTVMALNDPTAIGALAALDEVNLTKKVLVYGIDGSPDGKSLIEEKMLTATVMQSPKQMGKKAIEAAYRLIYKKKVKHEIVIPVKLITQDNIHKFDVKNWQ